MNLLEIRTKAAQQSGRYDLVNPSTFADNGMDFHITSGQKFLDKLIPVPESFAQIFEALSAGSYSLTFQQKCRSISSVFVNNSTDRFELEKISLNELKTYYTKTIDNIDSGKPLAFAIAHLRALETTAKTSLGTFINLTWAETDTKYDYRGIIIVPPVNEDYVVEISGQFLQKVLTSDTDENFWSLEYPNLLLMATLRSIEIFNRNTEGARDWTNAIHEEILELDFDIAEEESYNIDQLEG